MPGFSTIKLHLSLIPYAILWKWVTKSGPHSREWNEVSSPERKVIYICYACDICLFFCMYVHNYLYQFGLMYIYLFLGYNPIPCCSLCSTYCSTFSYWESFPIGACVPLTYPHEFLSTFLIYGTIRCAVSSYISRAPALVLTTSSKSPISFY